jgi:hypothetical protein
MHAARRPIGTSRRTVRRSARRYSVCGLSRERKKAIEHLASTASLRRLWWRSGALFLAFTIGAAYVVCLSPVVAADPSRSTMTYSFDDFANAARPR